MVKRITTFLKLRINILRNLIWNNSCLSLDTKKVNLPLTTRVYGKVKLICKSDASIVLGENIVLNSKPDGYHGGMPFGTTLLADYTDAEIRIGNNCRINGTYIHAKRKIVIGNNCVLAAGATIIDSNGHMLISKDRTRGEDTPKEIIIGNNVWVCLNSIVLKGSVIGDNCVIAANSVVKGFFPANSMIQGNPAVIVSELPIDNKINVHDSNCSDI